MNNSNIARDHITLEAMKILMQKRINVKKNLFGKVISVNSIDKFLLANEAYNIADAMIAERERNKGK